MFAPPVAKRQPNAVELRATNRRCGVRRRLAAAAPIATSNWRTCTSGPSAIKLCSGFFRRTGRAPSRMSTAARTPGLPGPTTPKIIIGAVDDRSSRRRTALPSKSCTRLPPPPRHLGSGANARPVGRRRRIKRRRRRRPKQPPTRLRKLCTRCCDRPASRWMHLLELIRAAVWRGFQWGAETFRRSGPSNRRGHERPRLHRGAPGRVWSGSVRAGDAPGTAVTCT